MAESRIKDENYYQISGFMINRLGLKGVALNVYAIIYGFTQDGESEFAGSLQYLCDFCGGVSKPTVINALKQLTAAGFILRREEHINNICFPRYRVNLPLLKEFNGGSKEILPNNKLDNNSFDNEEDNAPDGDENENKLNVYKGNILLTEKQMGNLLEIMGLEVFDEYYNRLARYIKKKNVVVRNHYETLLKWYNQDRAVKA